MLNSLLNKLNGFKGDLIKFIESPELLNTITELKREELFQGKRGDGKDITPNYEQVPFYAGWYTDWKKKTLSTYRLDGTPDLYIDGTFHRSLFTKMIDIGIYETDSDYSQVFMFEVVRVHWGNGTLLDLTEDSKNIIANEIEKFVLKNFAF